MLTITLSQLDKETELARRLAKMWARMEGGKSPHQGAYRGLKRQVGIEIDFLPSEYAFFAVPNENK